jgi:hypothetical protein
MAVGLWYPVGSPACRGLGAVGPRDDLGSLAGLPHGGSLPHGGLGAVVCLDSVRQSVSARASGTASTAG